MPIQTTTKLNAAAPNPTAIVRGRTIAVEEIAVKCFGYSS